MTDAMDESPSLAAAQQLAEDCINNLYQRDITAQSLGIEILHVAPGRAQLSMRVRDDMLNGHQICHGGFSFTLADTAFAYACNSFNQSNVGVGAQIQYVAPGKPGDCLTATATELSRKGRNGIYDVVIKNQHGEELAFFRGNSRQINGQVLEE
jgi:acyl-CoA thioesterase